MYQCLTEPLWSTVTFPWLLTFMVLRFYTSVKDLSVNICIHTTDQQLDLVFQDFIQLFSQQCL